MSQLENSLDMKVFKIRFKQHYNNKMFNNWVIVVAKTEELAKEFASHDLINKVPGYCYIYQVKLLCVVNSDKSKYVDNDFIQLIPVPPIGTVCVPASGTQERIT